MAELISDRDIEKLNKIKQTLKEVKEILEQIKGIDNDFTLSNTIEADEDTILIFNLNVHTPRKIIEELETSLSSKLKHKCVVLQNGLSLDTAIGIDYAKGRDYTTTTYYNDEGNPVKEETTQYK